MRSVAGKARTLAHDGAERIDEFRAPDTGQRLEKISGRLGQVTCGPAKIQTARAWFQWM